MDSVPSNPAEAIPTENAICPICHDDLYRPEDPEFAGRHVTIARPCGHKFHLNCLTPWTDGHLTCPVGRRVIEIVEVEILTLPPDWRQQMITAAKEGDIRTIRALLNRGADVGAGQPGEPTPLTWAATNKHLEVALLLASRGGPDPIGLCKLGDLFQDGGKDFPVNLHEAELWYLKAIEHGHTGAMNNLGLLYLYGGEGLPANPEQGKRLLLKAVGLGNASAMNNLGCLYRDGGEGFEVDLPQARALFLKAAGLGDASAMRNLKKLPEPQPAKKRGFDEAFPDEPDHACPEGESGARSLVMDIFGGYPV